MSALRKHLCLRYADLMTAQFKQWFPPKAGRVHEASGPAAWGFAAMLSGLGKGPVLWITEAWETACINPVGLSVFMDPANLLTAKGKDQIEVLAVAEEALRDGSVPLVVLELTKPLDLTAGRRLQLAAEAGKSTGLCLIPEGMGSNAAETRWHCTPLYDVAARGGDSTLQRWQLIKNKSGTLGSWDVRWDQTARRVIVVSPAGERPGSAAADR